MYPATCSAWASGHFSAQTARRDCLLVVGVTPTGNRDAGKFAADAHSIADGLPTRKPSETSSSPLAQGNPAAAAYAPRELDDHSFGPEDIASMSAAFEAALGQLGSIERNDLATMAIAKVIIGLAKEGERDAGRLCALALKRISK